MGCDPLFLGIVKVEEPDVRGLNILRELTESVLSIPVNSTLVNDAESGSAGWSTIYLELLCSYVQKRNDYAPMDFSPTSTKTAQRDLIVMLRRDPRNNSLDVTQPMVHSVSPQGTEEETLSEVIKCFDGVGFPRSTTNPRLKHPSIWLAMASSFATIRRRRSMTSR